MYYLQNTGIFTQHAPEHALRLDMEKPL